MNLYINIIVRNITFEENNIMKKTLILVFFVLFNIITGYGQQKISIAVLELDAVLKLDRPGLQVGRRGCLLGQRRARLTVLVAGEQRFVDGAAEHESVDRDADLNVVRLHEVAFGGDAQLVTAGRSAGLRRTAAACGETGNEHQCGHEGQEPASADAYGSGAAHGLGSSP